MSTPTDEQAPSAKVFANGALSAWCAKFATPSAWQKNDTHIVADTNVLVSALAFGGLPRVVLELAEAGQCQLFSPNPFGKKFALSVDIDCYCSKIF